MEEKNLSRRKFLKGGAVLGAAVGLSTLAGGKPTEEVAKALGKKELDSFPYEISEDFKPFDERDHTISRLIFGEKTLLEGLETDFAGFYFGYENRPGMTHLDMALLNGAYSTETFFLPQVFHWNYKPVTEEQCEFASKKEASKAIKKAAKFFGADLVGITPYDEKWMYEPKVTTNDHSIVSQSECPFQPKSVIVMAIEMDYKTFSMAPTFLGDSAATLAYSQMVELTLKTTNFLNHLGYNAYASGNDAGQNVPYAIAAGLGEQGRQGLLITHEYGPRVRICKVFTDLELEYDKPIKFGANDFCKVCKKCATNCPSQSISLLDDKTWKAENYSMSNHEGVLKYYVNVETCYDYWGKCKNGCGVCIAVCPYNKPDFWHHKITTALTSTPLKPFLNEMDDIFGYGNVFDEQGMIDYWDIEGYIK